MTPSELIDKQIADYPDWRGEIMTKLRALIHEVDPGITEEWKWGTGVYTHNSMVCAVSAFKNHVKMNFFKGAQLKDRHSLFNAGLDAKIMRSIDLHEENTIKNSELKNLIREAVALTTSK